MEYVFIIMFVVGILWAVLSPDQKSRSKFDEAAFDEKITPLNENELLQVRKEYFSMLEGAYGTKYEDYYRNCIGRIDQRLYEMHHTDE